MKTQFLTACLCLLLAQIAAADPKAKLTIKVVDDFGEPVAGATVRMSSYDYSAKDPLGKGQTAQTDTNGVATLTGKSRTQYVGTGILPKEGFYYTRGDDYWFKEVKDGKWQPWNPTIELVLKPILNPVPVYASSPEAYIKKPNQKYAFDLLVGDWVVPEGKGEKADILFEVIGYWKTNREYDSTLIVSFPNPLDGIQEFITLPQGKGSDLRSPREAPLDGYLQEIRLRKARKPGQLVKDFINDAGGEHHYFFRIRSVVDEKGQLKSAFYGKIHEGFTFGGAVENCYLNIRTCYLNPESNSRNMEFDYKKNLFEKPKAAKK